jgi:universal stress protein E
MRLCPCPVLFVNDPKFATYDDILAAVDPVHEGPQAQTADRAVLTLATAFAAAFDSRLNIVHAYPDPDDFSWVSSVEVKPGIFYGPENFERLHREAVEELVAAFGIGPEHVALATGDPRVVIPEMARERNTQLLVLGALERGTFEQAMLGSTAEAVIAEATCDVLLVKPMAMRGPVPVG